MNRPIFKLAGLLATAMLVARAPLCPCSGTSHSADAVEVSPCCRQDVPVSPNGDHKSGPRRDDRSHGSHQPTSEGRHCPCPEPCQCALENLQTAIIADAVTADCMDRQSPYWLGAASVLLDAFASAPEGLGHHAGSAGSLIDAGILARGNPCALLCRWLF